MQANAHTFCHNFDLPERSRYPPGQKYAAPTCSDRIAEATLFSTSRIGGPILFLSSWTFPHRRTGW